MLSCYPSSPACWLSRLRSPTRSESSAAVALIHIRSVRVATRSVGLRSSGRAQRGSEAFESAPSSSASGSIESGSVCNRTPSRDRLVPKCERATSPSVPAKQRSPAWSGRGSHENREPTGFVIDARWFCATEETGCAGSSGFQSPPLLRRVRKPRPTKSDDG